MGLHLGEHAQGRVCRKPLLEDDEPEEDSGSGVEGGEKDGLQVRGDEQAALGQGCDKDKG